MINPNVIKDWRPEGYWEALIGSFLRSPDESLPLHDASMLTLPGNFLSHAMLRTSPRLRLTGITPCQSHPLSATTPSASWLQKNMAPNTQYASALNRPGAMQLYPGAHARLEDRDGQQKLTAKTKKNKSFRKKDGTNLKD